MVHDFRDVDRLLGSGSCADFGGLEVDGGVWSRSS